MLLVLYPYIHIYVRYSCPYKTGVAACSWLYTKYIYIHFQHILTSGLHKNSENDNATVKGKKRKNMHAAPRKHSIYSR